MQAPATTSSLCLEFFITAEIAAKVDVTGIEVDAGRVTRKPSAMIKNGGNVQKCCWDRATRATDGKGNCYGKANRIVWIVTSWSCGWERPSQDCMDHKRDACRYFPLVCCGPAVFSARRGAP
eukprot:CAMPEP_0196654974 /NCGR_PEP_ID=MMETSP1086-20130531/4728_1 /TAXON_ID=77921 /ORGANISM="Cyanoptyche  gloeocystis , Strain SAG4.97" /LENGTH=121 /DNA_ID=CAMNT_0041987043 /DNA_START=989 /DNA_END=1350 /DNA_ORIENTATION=+